MRVKLVGQWAQLGNLGKAQLAKIEKAIDATIKSEAHIFAENSKDAMMSRGASNKDPWPRLSKWSEMLSGTGIPLLDSLRLYQSITMKPYGHHKYLVYIKPRMYPKKQGSTKAKTTADVATIHENGAFFTMRMTRKMMFFLINRARELGLPPKQGPGNSLGAFLTIRIPKRSFLKSTEIAHFDFRKRGERAMKTFAHHMSKP